MRGILTHLSLLIFTHTPALPMTSKEIVFLIQHQQICNEKILQYNIRRINSTCKTLIYCYKSVFYTLFIGTVKCFRLLNILRSYISHFRRAEG